MNGTEYQALVTQIRELGQAYFEGKARVDLLREDVMQIPPALGAEARGAIQDPYYFRSGYTKRRFIRALRRQRFTDAEAERLSALALRIVGKGERGQGYFREFAKLGWRLPSTDLEEKLTNLASSGVERQAARARFMLEKVRLASTTE